METSGNRIVLFSNGMADIQRVLPICANEALKVSIPVKKEHIADVLATVSIFGNVKVMRPLSYRPANVNDGSLHIDVKNTLTSLATQLSGVDVELQLDGERQLKGCLLGLHEDEVGTGGQKVIRKHLVVNTDHGLERVLLEEVKSTYFCNEDVREEVDKALKRNFQQIRPESTFIDGEVISEEDGEIGLQYTVPVAAWKMSYRLNVRGDDVSLHGLAIVDNNTEEDWRNVNLAVVTGDPIAFSTNLADSVIPRREHVNVVKTTALGAVDLGGDPLDDGDMSELLSQVVGGGPAAVAGGADLDGASGEIESLMESLGGDDSATEDFAAGSAFKSRMALVDDVAEQTEVGDFAIFETPSEVTINSKHSAVIPIMSKDLENAKRTLYFDEKKHKSRSFRCISFENETGHNLERGVCSVYEDGIFSGECVMPSLSKDSEALLPHALEWGVKFKVLNSNLKKDTTALSLKNGFYKATHRSSCNDVIYIHNTKDEPFYLVFERHYRLGRESNLSCKVGNSVIEPAKTTEASARYKIELKPNEKTNIRIEEVSEKVSSRSLGNSDLSLFEHSIKDGPFEEDLSVALCLELSLEIDKKKSDKRYVEQEKKRLVQKQDRLRKNLAAVKHDGQSAQWRNDLSAAENRITEIEEKRLPIIEKEIKELESKLRQAIIDVDLSWNLD